MSASPVGSAASAPAPSTEQSSVGAALRALRLFAGPLPTFDPAAAPAEPHTLFVSWLLNAIESNVVEPHAMTLSTVDADGHPSARQLLLRDVDEQGWQFAINCTSRKGKELALKPWVALTFYWQPLARQIRIKGAAHSLGAEASGADFRLSPADARVTALMGRQSQPLADRAALISAAADATARLADDPDLVAPEWRLYTVNATEVEFFQGDKNRQHTRLRYQRNGTSWQHHELWP